ncbi:MAG: hypothetical protein PUC49_05530, partial [Clostridiales bacterium]|nr:hypothetical protein [Clostridiales bacterium]
MWLFSGGSGKSQAPIPAAIIVDKMIRKPEEIRLSPGTQRIMQEQKMARITTTQTFFFSRAAGTIKAINMAYKPMPIADCNSAGSKVEIVPPKNVPSTQPIKGNVMSPPKKPAPICPGSMDAMTKVSSVMQKLRISRFQ